MIAVLHVSAGAVAPPDVVLYVSTASVRAGAWTIASDPTAAGGAARNDGTIVAKP